MFELLRQKPCSTLRMANQIKSNWDELFDAISHSYGVSTLEKIRNPDFFPSIEILEKKDMYIASLEMPGIPKEDIDVSINENNNTIIIKGEKKQDSKEEGDNYYICERSYGTFQKEISVPKGTTLEQISADYQNGVLKLKIPKETKKETEKKKIPIKIN